MGHFTVVCSMTWPLKDSEVSCHLVFVKTSLFLLCKSTGVLMPNGWHSNEKSREVCIKARSPPASRNNGYMQVYFKPLTNFIFVFYKIAI